MKRNSQQNPSPLELNHFHDSNQEPSTHKQRWVITKSGKKLPFYSEKGAKQTQKSTLHTRNGLLETTKSPEILLSKQNPRNAIHFRRKKEWCITFRNSWTASKVHPFFSHETLETPERARESIVEWIPNMKRNEGLEPRERGKLLLTCELRHACWITAGYEYIWPVRCLKIRLTLWLRPSKRVGSVGSDHVYPYP